MPQCDSARSGGSISIHRPTNTYPSARARDAVPDPGSELIKKVALVAILTRYRLELDRRGRLDWRFAGITIPKGGVWSDSWIGIVSHKRSPLGARFSISSKGRRWNDRAK